MKTKSKRNISSFCLVLSMLAMTLCVAYCGKSAETSMYFPVINEWRCDTEGYLISWNVYDYSPEGYLLTERHFGSYEVEMYDTIISDQIEIMTYHYDEAGRMIQQFHGYQYDDYNDHDIHYAKVTTNYWYNERGRRIRTEETDRRFVVRNPLKGLDDDNLIQQSEQITRSDCVITENDKTGGWKSLETFTFTGEDAVYNGQTVEMEYDADGKLLSRTILIWAGMKINTGL